MWLLYFVEYDLIHQNKGTFLENLFIIKQSDIDLISDHAGKSLPNLVPELKFLLNQRS